jgi:Spy/CpxP family protein refolding chaperone
MKDFSITRVALLTGIFFLLLGYASYGQRSGEDMRQIHDAKVSMISNRLKLTAEQSEKFWPVYNEFSEKRRGIRRALRKVISERRDGGMTDRVALESLKEVQELKQKEVDLEKQYQERFLAVITPSQLAELQSAEKSFNDMLLQRLDRRRE